VRGEGLLEKGSLRFTCRAGLAPSAQGAQSVAPSPSSGGASSSTARSKAPSGAAQRAQTVVDDQVVVIVKHMQTEAQVWIRVSKLATISEVRAKVASTLGLPKGATVRMLQQCGGGFTPFPDKQTLGAIRTLNCAGTAWYDVTLSEARSKEFLQDILAASETGTVQAKIAA
ncbi:unnamed protein product, partial [Polarella glacialis]